MRPESYEVALRWPLVADPVCRQTNSKPSKPFSRLSKTFLPPTRVLDRLKFNFLARKSSNYVLGLKAVDNDCERVQNAFELARLRSLRRRTGDPTLQERVLLPGLGAWSSGLGADQGAAVTQYCVQLQAIDMVADFSIRNSLRPAPMPASFPKPD